MILGFSTKINDKETYFVEKITKAIYLYKCFSLNGLQLSPINEELRIYNDSITKTASYLGYNDFRHLQDAMELMHPKLHTIREDKNNRWKRDVIIDFFINVRKKNMFKFTPKIPVVSTQKITMSYAWNDIINIYIGANELTPSERLKLAINDGFDNWEDFFNYFYPVIKSTKDNFWNGKIIHWTDLKY